MTRPTGIPVFQRFFREVASLDMDKDDLRRYRRFVDETIDDIAVAGRNSAKWNGRDVIAPQDLPITKGLQERMREFDGLDVADEVRELLRATVRRPPGDVTFAEDTEQLATPAGPPGSTPATPTPTGAPRSSVTVTTVSPIDARPE